MSEPPAQEISPEPPPEELSALARRHGLPATAEPALRVIWERLTRDEHAPTAVRGSRDVLERHIADSLVGLELPQVRAARTIADLGAGAGLPGAALAAALPAAEVRAVESQRSKCAYISSLATAARLGNLRVVCSRAEDWREGFGVHDLLVARALAAQPVVLEYAAPLLAEGGHLVEWRGRREAGEESAGDAAARALGLDRVEVRRVEPFAGARDRHLHVFVKSAPTPPRFPRRAGVAARRPLGS